MFGTRSRYRDYRCAYNLRGRVFTLLDVFWSANRLLSLALGVLIVDSIGVQALYWIGGTLLAIAGLLGLKLLGPYDFRSRDARSA